MNAQANCIHERNTSPKSLSLNAIATGGLRTLLVSGFIPRNARRVSFKRVQDLDGRPFLKVTAMDTKPIPIRPEVREALASCFVRFMRNTRPECLAGAAPHDVWEWTNIVGGG